MYVTLFVFIEFFPFFYNSKNNNRWHYLSERLRNGVSEQNIEVLFLGESRVNAAIDVNKIKNTWSFAAGGATSIEMFYTLVNYLKINPKPQIIYYSLSPRSMIELFSFWDFAVRNDFFYYNEIAEIIRISGELEKHKTLQTIIETAGDIGVATNIQKKQTSVPPILKYFSYRANYIGYFQLDIRQSSIVGAKEENLREFEIMDSMRGRRPHPALTTDYPKENYETQLKHFLPPRLLHYYFMRTLDLCNKSGIKVIFEFSPMNETSVACLKPSFVSEYQVYMQKIAEKYPAFEISDSIITYPDNQFGDPSHLNKSGRERFTDYLILSYFSEMKTEKEVF